MTADDLLAYADALYGDLDELDDSPWWLGTCDSVLATLEEEGALADAGARPAWWGGAYGAGHCWVVMADGAIVDPTAWQFGPDTPRVVRPGDVAYGEYQEAGS